MKSLHWFCKISSTTGSSPHLPNISFRGQLVLFIYEFSSTVALLRLLVSFLNQNPYPLISLILQLPPATFAPPVLSSMCPHSSDPTPSKLSSSTSFSLLIKFSSSTVQAIFPDAQVFFLDGASYLPRRCMFSSSTGSFLRLWSPMPHNKGLLGSTASLSSATDFSSPTAQVFFPDDASFLPRRCMFSSSTVSSSTALPPPGFKDYLPTPDGFIPFCICLHKKRISYSSYAWPHRWPGQLLQLHVIMLHRKYFPLSYSTWLSHDVLFPLILWLCCSHNLMSRVLLQASLTARLAVAHFATCH